MSADAEQAMAKELRAALRGEVIDRRNHGYDEARRVWNGLIDRRPAVIARCATVADVVETVRVARRFRPSVSIRGGGHQVAGSAVCDDGLVVDLGAMHGVHVDPVQRTAQVQGGATWGDVDRETQMFGLATPGGEVSTTGVAGLTLGGGLGVMMRTHGLSCDNLRSVEIVTADGMVRTASRDEHTDLFWALRGGGRGLGVVTSLEFDLHPLGPEVACALVLYPYDEAVTVLRAWCEVARHSPDTLAPEIGLWSVPPDPELPAELHHVPTVLVAGVYIGSPRDADPALEPLRRLGTPLADLSGPMPYVESQAALDVLFPKGGRYYWKSHFVNEFTDELIETVVRHGAARPAPESMIFVRTTGGAVSRVGESETAYPHRAARFNISVDASWHDPALDEAAVGWARESWQSIAPFATGGLYLNFAGLGDDDGLRTAAFGPNAARLEEIRRAYDSGGLFDSAAARP